MGTFGFGGAERGLRFLGIWSVVRLDGGVRSSSTSSGRETRPAQPRPAPSAFRKSHGDCPAAPGPLPGSSWHGNSPVRRRSRRPSVAGAGQDDLMDQGGGCRSGRSGRDRGCGRQLHRRVGRTPKGARPSEGRARAMTSRTATGSVRGLPCALGRGGGAARRTDSERVRDRGPRPGGRLGHGERGRRGACAPGPNPGGPGRRASHRARPPARRARCYREDGSPRRPDRRATPRDRRSPRRSRPQVLGGQGVPRRRQPRPRTVSRPAPQAVEAPPQHHPHQDPLPRHEAASGGVTGQTDLPVVARRPTP